MAGKVSQNSDLTGAKLRVVQTRSVIGRDERVRSTLRALGLGRIGRSVEVTASPSIVGMIDRIKAVVTVDLSK
jgi:large subunit ribosomal protein L30